MICNPFRLVRERPRATAAALALLLTTGAAWVWAHEGHEPIPSRGAEPIRDGQGRIVGVSLARAARASIDLHTEEVTSRPVQERVLAYASLVAPVGRHGFATARLPGRVVALHARPGQAVRAGQPLAEVEGLELEALQLELLNAHNDLRLSEKVVKELEESAARGAVAEQALLDARARRRKDENALDVARSKWLGVGLPADRLDRLPDEGKFALLRTLPVVSPVGGTVVHADLAVGKVVRPGEHLFEVVDLSTVWAKVGVLEKDLHHVEVGHEVELSFPAHPGETFRSTVRVKGLFLDPQTHLNAVWAELLNPPGREPRLLPGMVGQAHLLLAPQARSASDGAVPSLALRASRPGPATGLTVPAAALVRDGVERYVLVEKSDAEVSQYLKVNVVVGRRSAEWVEVSGDLYRGDRVVTRGAHELAGFFVPGVLRVGPEAARNAGLRVEPARRRVIEEVVEVEGAVEVPPDRRAAVSSQLDGVLLHIHVEPGQAVRAGQVLAEVASLGLQDLQLDLLRVHLEVGLLEEQLGRLRGAARSVSARQVWETEGRVNAARNQAAALRRKLEAAGLSAEQVNGLLSEKRLVESLPLRAPFAGVVNFEGVLGQAVRAEDPLFEVHDLARPWVQGHVPAGEVARVQVGQRAWVRLVADPAFLGEGAVVRSGRVLGEESRTLSVWVELDRHPEQPLRHGQLARLTLTVRRHPPALAVPLSAVVQEGSRSYLFVRARDGTFERRGVETGRADDRHVQIVRGVAEGEAVAVEGGEELQTAYASLR